MADMSVDVNMNMKGGDIATKIATGVQNALGKLGLGNVVKGFTSVFTGKGPEKGEKGFGFTAGKVAGFASIIIAGIGLIGGFMKKIVGFLSEYVPGVSAVMKLFKLILMILFLPLTIILIPILKKLGDFAGRMMSWIDKFIGGKSTLGETMGGISKGLTDLLKELAPAFTEMAKIMISVFGEIWEAIKEPFLKTIIPIMADITTALIIAVVTNWKFFLEKMAESITEQVGKKTAGVIGIILTVLATAALFVLGGWILAAVGLVVAGLIVFWDEIKSAFLNALAGFIVLLMKIWEGIKGIVDFFAKLPAEIASRILSSLNGLKNIGQRISDIIIGWVSKLAGKFTKQQTGGMISSEGLYHLHRGEKVVSATQVAQTGSTGNTGMVININIDKPVVRAEDDARKLTELIERRLIQEMRRRVSYVGG